MATRFASRFWQALLLVVCLLSFSDSLVEAQSESDGFKSSEFDAKYIPFQELLITPKTHSGLFSFTGRWHRRRETYSASTWPGTYVTVLIYGDTCILKLRPKPMGQVGDYSFYVSVDGGEDLLYTLPPFNSHAKDREIIYVPITIPGAKTGPEATKTLTPHTIRMISVTDYPLSFEGFLVSNTLVRQGQLWTDGQDARPYVEFIGEGRDAEAYGGFLGWDHDTTNSGGGVGDDGGANAVKQVVQYSVSVLNSTQFRAAEALGIRHSHTDSGTCFLTACDPRDPLPGLSEQYFNENPIAPDIRSDEIKKASKQFQQLIQQKTQFFREDPWLRQIKPTAVILDVGVRDFMRLEEPVSSEKFQRELMVFLGRLRESARPDATIVVIARDWANADAGASKPLFRSRIAQTEETLTLRKKLYDAVKYAVVQVQEEDKGVQLATITPSGSPKRDLVDILCTFAIPAFRATKKSTGVASKKAEPNRQQQVCLAIGNKKHLSPPATDPAEHLEHHHNEEHAGLKQEEHTVPHETAHGSRFIFLYVLVAIGFLVGLAFLLSKPFLMILINMGIVRGNKRVFGVRDTESGFGFGFGHSGKGRFSKDKKSMSVLPRSNSASEEEGFVVLAGGGSQSLGPRRGAAAKNKA